MCCIYTRSGRLLLMAFVVASLGCAPTAPSVNDSGEGGHSAVLTPVHLRSQFPPLTSLADASFVVAEEDSLTSAKSLNHRKPANELRDDVRALITTYLRLIRSGFEALDASVRDPLVQALQNAGLLINGKLNVGFSDEARAFWPDEVIQDFTKNIVPQAAAASGGASHFLRAAVQTKGAIYQRIAELADKGDNVSGLSLRSPADPHHLLIIADGWADYASNYGAVPSGPNGENYLLEDNAALVASAFLSPAFDIATPSEEEAPDTSPAADCDAAKHAEVFVKRVRRPRNSTVTVPYDFGLSETGCRPGKVCYEAVEDALVFVVVNRNPTFALLGSATLFYADGSRLGPPGPRGGCEGCRVIEGTTYRSGLTIVNLIAYPESTGVSATNNVLDAGNLTGTSSEVLGMTDCHTDGSQSYEILPDGTALVHVGGGEPSFFDPVSGSWSTSGKYVGTNVKATGGVFYLLIDRNSGCAVDESTRTYQFHIPSSLNDEIPLTPDPR